MSMLRSFPTSLALTSLEQALGGRSEIVADAWLPFPVEPPRRDLDIVF